MKEHVTSNFKTHDMVRLYWQVAGKWSTRSMGGPEEAQNDLGQQEQSENKRQQDRQCTYNVTLRRVHVTIVAMEKQ
jgi:hypothetical protein